MKIDILNIQDLNPNRETQIANLFKQLGGEKVQTNLREVLEEEKKKGLTEILLFTEDHRIPAIRLYLDLDYKLKESQIYTLKICHRR